MFPSLGLGSGVAFGTVNWITNKQNSTLKLRTNTNSVSQDHGVSDRSCQGVAYNYDESTLKSGNTRRLAIPLSTPHSAFR